MMPVINIDTNEYFHIAGYEEIMFINFQKELDFFYLHGGTYRCPKNKKEYHAALQSYGFEFVDSSTIAQVNKITRYDHLRRIAYFEHPEFPTQACYVSTERAKKLHL